MKKSAGFSFHLSIVAFLFAVTIFTSALCSTGPELDLDADGLPGVSNFQATSSGSRMRTMAAKAFAPVRAASNGKKVLFYTKLNDQWLDYTTELLNGGMGVWSSVLTRTCSQTTVLLRQTPPGCKIQLSPSIYSTGWQSCRLSRLKLLSPRILLC